MDSIAVTRAAHRAVSSLAQASPSPTSTHPATTTPHPSGTGAGVANWIGHVLTWAGQKSGLGVLGVVVVLGGLAWAYEQMPKSSAGDKARAKERDAAIEKAVKGLFAALARLVSGRPIASKSAVKKKESGGRFWDPIAKPPTPEVSVAALGSVALPGPVSEPWQGWDTWEAKLTGFQDWMEAQAGKVPGLMVKAGTIAAGLGLLAMDAGRWLVKAAGWTGKAVRGLWVLPTALWSSAQSYPRWAYSWVLAVRLVAVGATLLYAQHPGATQAGLATAAGIAVIASVTGPAGLGFWKGRVPGDDEVYGPALWVLLRRMLELPPDALQENWLHLPYDLKDRDAQVAVKLPLEFLGSDGERADLDHLVNSRLPGEWVSRWHLAGANHFVKWTHKPPPKPKPMAPDYVDFFSPEIQAAIASCELGEVVVGVDAFGRAVKKRLEGDTAHWVLSIGSGGGKSTLIQFIVCQLVAQCFTVLAVDPKRNSVANFIGLPGFYLWNDPGAVGDMRSGLAWYKKVAEARQFVALRNPGIEFPGMVFIMEEANELADLSRAWWDKNKPPKARATDPFWGEVASTLRTARSVNGHVLGVFQDLRDDKTGNQGMSVLFPEILMGKFKEKQWDRIIGGRMPDIAGNDRAGRILVNVDGERVWVQVPFAKPEQLMDWATEARKRVPWSYEQAGLYGTPPGNSEQAVPELLKGTSHDPAVQPAPRVLLDKIPGQKHDSAQHDGVRDTAHDGQRDELRATLEDVLARHDQQAGPGPQDAVPAVQQAPEPPEERLSVAEIARRFAAQGIAIKADRIRAQKARDKDNFPKGEGEKGREKFLATEILAYFQEREAKKEQA